MAEGRQGRASDTLPDDIDVQVLDVNDWQRRGKHPLLNADLVRIFEQLAGRPGLDAASLLVNRVPEKYRAQALHLLEQFVRYRDELAQMTAPRGGGQLGQLNFPGESAQALNMDYSATAGALETALLTRQAVQEKYFTAAEVDGLFGDDNRYDQFTVERLRLRAREDLSLAEKEQRLEVLSNQLLSPEQREARYAALLPTRIAAQNEAFHTADATVLDERQAARSREFGTAATQRLAELDRQQAEWQQRIARYDQADSAVRQQMRETEFTPQEQLRLDAALSLYRRQQAGK
ncbi:MAG: hypothetical protein KUL75_09490 [Sterolibacterium sp.]|nr:hypothetical protein [Sterolibacterium sp.]